MTVEFRLLLYAEKFRLLLYTEVLESFVTSQYLLECQLMGPPALWRLRTIESAPESQCLDARDSI